MQKSLDIYNETNRKLKALAYCGFLSGWDINTEMPPKADHEEQLSALSEMSYTLQTSDEYSAAVDDLYAHRDELSDVLKHEIEAAVLSKQKLKKVRWTNTSNTARFLTASTTSTSKRRTKAISRLRFRITKRWLSLSANTFSGNRPTSFPATTFCLTNSRRERAESNTTNFLIF